MSEAKDRNSYAARKLTDAIRILATHPGDARERLMVAYMAFHPLQERDFPAKYRRTWRSVMGAMTKFGHIEDHDGRIVVGSVENTMSRIRKRTASQIAEKLYRLYWVVTENTEYL